MAQVPLRMAQPGLVPPHQQRPPMMVSMTQPPPVSMQGLVSMAPMMGPGGGMALVTQAMNHPDSGHDHHTMNGPFHHHHHHHHPHHAHHPAHGAAPRPHGPSQGPHSVAPPPPPHPSGPPHSQYHPHPGAQHHVPHSHHSGPHSVHHSSSHSASHSHSGPPPPPHMSHSNSSNSNTHSSHGHPQSHLQSGPHHMNQPGGHSIPIHSPHQMGGMGAGTMSSGQHHTQQQQQTQQQQSQPQQQQHHSQHLHHHQPIHQQMQHSQLPPQQLPPSQPPPQHLQHQILGQPPQHQVSHGPDTSKLAPGMIVLSNTTEPSCNTMSIATTLNATTNTGVCSNAVVNGIVNRSSSAGNLNVETTLTTSSNCNASMISTREKTPMCLINELARYNKISHQYCLTDEKGPAHKKIFTVTLKLGDNEEEYSASGPSIKKAQHSAAALSLDKTKFKHPPPKTPKQNKQTKLTPTVELNALAMKRGEAAVYTFLEPPRPPNPYAYNVLPNIRGVYSQKFYGRPPVYPMFFVSLRVGNRDFGGEGATAQQAKHHAASKALKVIKALPMPETGVSGVQSMPGVRNTAGPPTTAAVVTVGVPGPVGGAPAGAELSQIDPNADLKSPISLVHEIALKRSFTVVFEVVRESGPPHMRTFVTTCTVGELRSQGEGTGKKVSKKRAAEMMLEELKKLPPLSTAALTRVKRKPSTKKKSRNLIKEQKAAPEYGQGINPISRLIQIQQAKKEKEPVYTLLAERGVPRRREFVMQVAVGTTTAQGSGPNKKLAKRAAAESMLQLLGYSRPQPQPAKPAIKMDGSHSDPDKTRKQVTFLEESEVSRASVHDSSQQQSGIHMQSIPPGSARQLVPGLIMMPDGSALHGFQQMQTSNMNPVVTMNQMVNLQATAAIAKELLESGSSPTAKALSKGQGNGTKTMSKMGTGVQTPISHQQQQTVVQSPQQTMQPHMNHQPMMQANPAPQLQSNQPQPQPQPTNSHTQIQSTATNVPMAVQANNVIHTNANSNNSNLSANNMNNTTNNSKNRLQGGALIISGNTSGQAVRPKDQLMYLANILGLQVQFTDFPKGSKNNSEYLSLVSLNTSPPHVTHGAGPTTEASHDQACLTALKALAEIGLDTVTSANASKTT